MPRSESRKKKTGQQEATRSHGEKNADGDSGKESGPGFFVEANPPRANFPLLIISGLLMVGWMVFLLYVAMSRS